MSDSSVYGLIGLTEESVGLDRRIYTGLTSTDPTLAVSYNSGRVDVFLNGVKLVGNHSEMPSGTKDYTFTATGQGSSITLATGVALVSSDVVEVMGYVSNSANTVTTYNYTASDGDTQFTANNSSGDLVNVFLNGVLLDSSDYNLTTANTVTLGSGAAASDIVHIQVIGALDHSNFVPAGGGTFSGNVSFGDNNITNVGDISLDTISSDAGTSIGVTLGTDAGDDFNVGSGKLVVEGDTGFVGIGRPDPQNELEVHNDTSNCGITISTDKVNGYSDLKLVNDAQTWLLRLDGSNDNLILRDETSLSTALTIDSTGNNDVTVNTGNLVIGTAGKGIDFSVNSHASGMTSELLDDYETGTFTMGITVGSGSASINGNFNTISYTKIGNIVHIRGGLHINSTSSPSGSVTLTGLPFTSIAGTEATGTGLIGIEVMQIGGTLSGVPASYIFGSSTEIKIYDKVQDSSAYGGDLANHLNSDCWIFLTGYYVVG